MRGATQEIYNVNRTKLQRFPKAGVTGILALS